MTDLNILFIERVLQASKLKNTTSLDLSGIEGGFSLLLSLLL
jgi:hypothetical protein